MAHVAGHQDSKCGERHDWRSVKSRGNECRDFKVRIYPGKDCFARVYHSPMMSYGFSGHIFCPGIGKRHHMARVNRKAETPLIKGEKLALTIGGRLVVEHVDIEISPGEIVTLIGPNGAGKTSLVRLLLGLVKPDKGAVSRVPGLTIGYVPQRFAVDATIPLTVERFLALTASADGDTATELLNEVGAEHLRNVQVSSLSGGEFQRVVLAKALVGNPQLLVLDEPVQNVDFSGEAELYRLIETIRNTRGCGILLVSHNLHVVLGASDRVVCLNHHVCCSGVPETVAKHPEYERLFGAKAAQAFAIYSHTHDHEHDLSGEVSDGPVSDSPVSDSHGH
jgi:zinc transport system ATP-binding protein